MSSERKLQRLNVQLRSDNYVNIPITDLEIVEDIIYAYNGQGNLVGFFDMGYIDALWISEYKSSEKLSK